MANEQNLKPFLKGDDPRRNTSGRPKKLVLEAKEFSYTPEQVKETLETMIGFPKDKIIDILKHNDASMIELICAKVLKKCYDNGSFFNLEMILSRAFGKPKETVDTNITGDLPSTTIVQVINTGVPLATSEKE